MTITRDVIAHHYKASDASVNHMLAQPTGDDGRSEWRWFHTTDGDLIIGFFPTGDGYSEAEGDMEADYNAADKAGEIGVLLGNEEGPPQVPYGIGVTPTWDAVTYHIYAYEALPLVEDPPDARALQRHLREYHKCWTNDPLPKMTGHHDAYHAKGKADPANIDAWQCGFPHRHA